MLRERLVAVQQELVNAQTDLNQKNEKISELNQSIVRLETTLVHERKADGKKIRLSLIILLKSFVMHFRHFPPKR